VSLSKPEIRATIPAIEHVDRRARRGQEADGTGSRRGAFDTPPAALGPSLRALRSDRKLSLSKVAAATGVSASFLSLVENGKSDIATGRLRRLLDFYGVSISDILPEPSSDDGVLRHEQRIRLHAPGPGVDLFLLTADTRRELMPMLLEFEPRGRLAEPGIHRGEEWVYVIEGELALELEGSELRVLRAGDSAYYSSERRHRFTNASTRKRLRIICVDAPPNI